MDEIFNRRSIRKYQDKKIPDEDIKLILKLDICCKVLQTTRSDVIRRSIEKYYEEIANK